MLLLRVHRDLRVTKFQSKALNFLYYPFCSISSLGLSYGTGVASGPLDPLTLDAKQIFANSLEPSYT